MYEVNISFALSFSISSIGLLTRARTMAILAVGNFGVIGDFRYHKLFAVKLILKENTRQVGASTEATYAGFIKIVGTPALPDAYLVRACSSYFVLGIMVIPSAAAFYCYLPEYP
jgi:hypothetical protein